MDLEIFLEILVPLVDLQDLMLDLHLAVNIFQTTSTSEMLSDSFACATLLIATAATTASTGNLNARYPFPHDRFLTHGEKHGRIMELKDTIHTLSFEEAHARLEEIHLQVGPPPPHQDRIDHFVVLLMENHAADNIFGCMERPGFDGVNPKTGHIIPAGKKNVTATCGSANRVCAKGPGYDLFESKFQDGSNAVMYPYGHQDDKYSFAHGAVNGTATELFAPEQIPIKSAVAENFGIFNKLYTAVPSASTPNHLFVQSATSCGIKDNILYSECGGPTDTFPQFTIYDNMYANNVTFGRK